MGFHFRLPGMHGGFSGVDVFYVISGYLMTAITATRLVAGRFSVIEFYTDRTLRIVPALIGLLLAALALGLLLVPLEYAILGKNVMMASLFAANLRFKTNYFGAEIDQEWLLHTWSLSLEWQFYLLFPLVMWALWRLLPRALLLPALAAAAAVSFAVSLWLTAYWPIAAFYLLPARSWELLAGGMVFLAPQLPTQLARPAQLAGLALLMLSAVLVRESGWPGWQALAPVAGTALVIAARQTTSVLTGNALFGWIGVNSYSIYLWHWPIALLVLRTHSGEPLWALLGIAASFLLGHASWRLIEALPRKTARRSTLAAGLIGGLLLTAGLGAAAARSHGWTARYDPAIGRVQTAMEAIPPYAPECFSVVGEVPAPCILRHGEIGAAAPGTDQIAVIVVGDSHAAAMVAGVLAAVPASGALRFNAYASCMPVLDGISSDPRSRCSAFNAQYLRPLTKPRTVPVLLVANWQAYLDEGTIVFGSAAAKPDPALLETRFIATACALTKAGPTWATLPEPSFAARVPHALQARLIAGTPGDITAPLAQHLRRDARALAMLQRASAQCGLQLIDPAAVLCQHDQCRGTLNGQPLYYDRNHLTVAGALLLRPLFAPLFAATRPIAETAR